MFENLLQMFTTRGYIFDQIPDDLKAVVGNNSDWSKGDFITLHKDTRERIYVHFECTTLKKDAYFSRLMDRICKSDVQRCIVIALDSPTPYVIKIFRGMCQNVFMELFLMDELFTPPPPPDCHISDTGPRDSASIRCSDWMCRYLGAKMGQFISYTRHSESGGMYKMWRKVNE